MLAHSPVPVPWDQAVSAPVPLTADALRAAGPGIHLVLLEEVAPEYAEYRTAYHASEWQLVIGAEEHELNGPKRGYRRYTPPNTPETRDTTRPLARLRMSPGSVGEGQTLLFPNTSGLFAVQPDTGAIFYAEQQIRACSLVTLQINAAVCWVPRRNMQTLDSSGEIVDLETADDVWMEADQFGDIRWVGRRDVSGYGQKQVYYSTHYVLCYAEDTEDAFVCK